jgi:glutamate 5-kinase
MWTAFTTTHPENENAELIQKVGINDSEPENAISGNHSEFGRGGMLTKFRIAKKLASDGISVHLANGLKENILVDILSNKRNSAHTWFEPAQKPASGVKKWIAYSDGFTKGSSCEQRALPTALKSDKAVSLLPVGIVKLKMSLKKAT